MTSGYDDGFIQDLRTTLALMNGDDYDTVAEVADALYDEIMFYTQAFGEEI